MKNRADRVQLLADLVEQFDGLEAELQSAGGDGTESVPTGGGASFLLRSAQEALCKSEARFRALTEHSWDAILLTSAEGVIQYASAAVTRILGQPADALLGRTLIDLVDPQETMALQAQLAVVASPGGGTVSMRARFRHAEGGTRLLEANLTNLLEHEAVHAVVANLRDITETVETRRQLERIFDLTLDMICVADFNGYFRELNAAWERVLGYTREELRARPYVEFVHPEDRAKTATTANDTHEGKEVYLFENRYRCKDGSYRWFQWVSRPVVSEGIVFACARDITERRRAEIAAREQAEMLQHAHDAIMLRDLEGRILFWNRGAERVFGWTAEEVAGIGAAQLFEEPGKHSAAVKAVLERGEWYGELRKPKKDGGTAIVASSWTLLRDEGGAPKSILVINSDISEYKKLETQFLRAQRLESIGTLASGVAHDLNNILAPVLMSVPVLRNDLPAELRDSILNTIETSAQRGAEIVRQVLTFARGAEGERLLIQPAHLIKEMARIAHETFPKTIEVRPSYPNDVWPIEADPTQIHQVLLNLCVNARDAMAEGGELVLSVKNLEIDENYAAMMAGATVGPHVVLEVRDSGGGIPHEIIDKIFDPFFTTKEAGKGTGLGLSTAMGIVKAHGGFIHVYSEPGMGTTFRIYLPAAPGASVAAEAPKNDLPPRAAGELILLVDDEGSIREVAKAALESHGYRVIAAAEAPDALALFAQRLGEVRVVITDLVMPLMDGVTLVRALRRMKPETAIIASTGRLKEKSAKELAELKVDLYLTKPYSKRDLLQQVRTALGQT